MHCLGWSPKSAFLLESARRRRGIERGGRTDDGEYHHVLGIELVNLLHGRCPFGVQCVATVCELCLPVALRLFIKVALPALTRPCRGERNYFGMANQSIHKRIREFLVYMFSHLKTPDQIEELSQVQRESKIVLTYEIRPLTAANRDARSLDSQRFKAALV